MRIGATETTTTSGVQTHVGRRVTYACPAITSAVIQGVQIWGTDVYTHELPICIAAVHAEASSISETDWARIVALYDLLLRAEPSPVVALNRAAALGMRDGAQAGLAAIEAAAGKGSLETYCLAYAARADMQRRLGLLTAARASYQRALELTRQPAEQRYLQKRLSQIDTAETKNSS